MHRLSDRFAWELSRLIAFRRLAEIDAILLVDVRSGEGPLTEHITATQAQPPERVFMPHCGHWLEPVAGVSVGRGNATFPVCPEWMPKLEKQSFTA
jgi:hypothetical protein